MASDARKSTIRTLVAIGVVLLSTHLAMPVRADEATRALWQLVPQHLKDTAENRARYPFLVPIFEEIQADNAEAKDIEPGRVDLAVVDKEDSGLDTDLAFAVISGSLYCGTAGCSFRGYALRSPEHFDELIYTNAQIPNSFFLSLCPGSVSILLKDGHGVSTSWGEWRYEGSSFKRTNDYRDLSFLPACTNSK